MNYTTRDIDVKPRDSSAEMSNFVLTGGSNSFVGN